MVNISGLFLHFFRQKLIASKVLSQYLKYDNLLSTQFQEMNFDNIWIKIKDFLSRFRKCFNK